MTKEAIDFIAENIAPFSKPVNGIRSIQDVVEHYEGLGHECTFTTEMDDDIELKILNVR